MFIGKWNPSVILTYLGISLSILGMYEVLFDEPAYAMVCLMLSGICDLFDGKIARRMKRTEEEKNFGIALDSLADVVSFIIFPIIIFIEAGGSAAFFLSISLIFAVCGTARLAFFNMSAFAKENNEYFRGLPVTYTALIIPLVYIFSYTLEPNIFRRIFPVVYLMIGFFNILDIKIAKPKRGAYIFFSLLAIAMTWIYLVILL